LFEEYWFSWLRCRPPHSAPRIRSGSVKGWDRGPTPIATSNPEAQKFFDQGLTLAHGFNRYEALRSFRQATDLDPDAAMAYWLAPPREKAEAR
jgi:hypothetical protein